MKFEIRNIDIFNVYNADLSDIEESARRTYGQAIRFFVMAEQEMLSILTTLHDSTIFPTREEIYDSANAAVTILAASCEMLLKSLYLYEHRADGVSAEDLWDRMRTSEFKVDGLGHYVYEKVLPTGNKVNVFVCVDDNGNVVRDSSGRVLYQDREGNIYSEGSQGKKIKMNGHDLDRLINMLSVESRFMLESRMRSIKMEDTFNNRRVSLVDWLQSKGLVSRKEEVSRDEYLDWVDKHRKTFEEARYAGQERRSASVEFMYHLATQIKAVVQYRLDPRENQKFEFDQRALEKQPQEIQKLADENPKLITPKLVASIANDDEFRTKFKNMMNRKYRFDMTTINAGPFWHALKECSERELSDISIIGYLRSGKCSLRLLDYSDKNESIAKVKDFVDYLDKLDVDMDTLVMFYIELKRLGFGEVAFGDFKTLIEGMFKPNSCKLDRIYKMGSILDEDDDILSKFIYNIQGR